MAKDDQEEVEPGAETEKPAASKRSRKRGASSSAKADDDTAASAADEESEDETAADEESPAPGLRAASVEPRGEIPDQPKGKSMIDVLRFKRSVGGKRRR